MIFDGDNNRCGGATFIWFYGKQLPIADPLAVPDDSWVCNTQTRRMHPDVCRLISEQVYEGRQASTRSAREAADDRGGHETRGLRAGYQANATSWIEEAEIIAAEIARLAGTPCVNFDGDEKPLTVNDFRVVAPYNDQVTHYPEAAGRYRRTASVAVGTFDKFQGGQAARSSSSAWPPGRCRHDPRCGILFSRNGSTSRSAEPRPLTR